MEALVCVNKGFNLSDVFIVFCWPPSTYYGKEHYLSLQVEEEPIKTDLSREGHFSYWSTGLICAYSLVKLFSSRCEDVRNSCITTVCHQDWETD